jgi:hypothetical protein
MVVPGYREVALEVGGLPGPRPEHPERVDDDGHAGEPHDGVGRLERRLHAAPHRHAYASADLLARRLAKLSFVFFVERKRSQVAWEEECNGMGRD